MRSIARGLGLPETIFDRYFEHGISTLRLIRYPLRDANAGVDTSGPEFSVVHKGETRTIIGREHANSGFVTLLAQDGVEGLQAKNLAGEWIDVPPANGTLAVNFGQLLERWTGGRVRATRHRVIAPKTAAVLDPVLLRTARRCRDRTVAAERRSALRAVPLWRLSLGVGDEFRRDEWHQASQAAAPRQGFLSPDAVVVGAAVIKAFWRALRAGRCTGPSPRGNPSSHAVRGRRHSSAGRARCSGSCPRLRPRRSARRS